MGKSVLGVYCAGGFGGVIKSLAEELHKWEEILYIDDDEAIADGVNIMTFNDFDKKYGPDNAEIIITAGEPRVRKLLFDKVKGNGYSLPNIFAPQMDMPALPEIGEGNVFFTYSSVAPNNVKIGNNNIVMEYSRVGHDSTIGSHCLIATKAVFAGDIEMGDCAYAGIGAIVKEQTRIGENAIISMGAVVLKDVPESSVVMGNPAMVIKKSNTGVFKNAKNPNEEKR